MGQVITLHANPGQTASLVIQTVDGYGERVNANVPQVMSIYFPDKSLAQGFPQAMTNIGVGLYSYDIAIPSGATSLGSFIANIRHTEDSSVVWNVYVISVARPFGNSSASPI